MTTAHDTSSRAPARVRGPLTGVPPDAKLLGLVAFLLVVAVTPPSRPWALAGQAAVAAGVAAASYVRARDIVPRLALDLPLVVLAATLALVGGRPGMVVGLAVLAKATIGIVAVSAVAASTTAPEMVAGLRRLRLPPWLCDLVALTARQLQVLGDEVTRIRLAGSVRAGTRGRRGEWSAVGRSLGVLFVRGVERADRLQVALAARGGALPPADSGAGEQSPRRPWPALALAPATVAAVLRLVAP